MPVVKRLKSAQILGTAALLFAGSMLYAEGAHAQANKVIVAWDHQTEGNAPKNARAAADRFEKQTPGYKVEDSHILNDAYKAKLKVAFGAEQPPCVFDTWGGGPLREYVKAGQVVDLTPFLQKDPAFRDRFLPTSWQAVTFNGKIYGIPSENTAVAVIFYNKDLFRQYNLAPPTTWDELMKVVKVFTSHGIAPFALANKSKWTGSMYYMYLVDRLGGPDVFRRAAQRAAGGSFAAPVFIEAGKYLQQLVKAGAFAQGYNGLDYDTGVSRRLLYSGRAAMELMGGWEASTIQKENPAFYRKLDFFPFPSMPGGKGDPRDVVGTVGDSFLSISAQCPERDGAFRLIRTMTDDASVQAKLADARIPPVKNLALSDPFLKRMQTLIAQAPNVQLWYDQELSPSLGERHKDISQALFGLSVTPEAAAAQMEDAAKAEAGR
ncbi:ABC transporter substrate-binding protein [Burkholderia savannae]|uniref:extracellular solute-binding protein n=1 Tax=Burkholderia savannae TaxID=1637837 RepID=UPI000763C98E|nr:extracellular solute-binding protein [Burkholderia savannae]KWZ46085.1 ABC transporter substrate-binding protein [Burkholderia savannae]